MIGALRKYIRTKIVLGGIHIRYLQSPLAGSIYAPQSWGTSVAVKLFLRKYRIIERFSSGGNFSRLRTAKIEGYLAGNRDFCRQQAAEIHPLMGREHCAVFP